MIHNRKTLLSFLATCGYDGTEDLAKAKAFIKSADLNLVEDDEKTAVDVDALWAKTASRTVKAAADDEGDDETETRLAGKRTVVVGKAARVDAANGIVRKGGSTFGIDFAKKSYDRKAAKGEANFSCAEEAEVACAYLRQKIGNVCGVEYEQADNDARIIAKTGLTTTTGQALIPDDLSTQLITLRESAVGASRFCDVQPLSRDVQNVPREVDEMTVYWPGEGNSATASDPTNDLVGMTARKAVGLTKVSVEYLNDAAINVADRLTDRMSYAILKAEERVSLLGDGTSTYGTHVGLTYRYQQMVAAAGGTWTTDAHKLYHAGVVAAAGNLFSEITEQNLLDMIGRVPQYDAPGGGDPMWLCSKPFFYATAARLGMGKGGVTSNEFENGYNVPRILGFKVIFSPYMLKVDTASGIPITFGYHNLGMKCGRVRGSMSISKSEHIGFVEDLLYFKITNRFAVTVHDIGNATSTASARVAGPIVALAMNNA